MGSVWCSGMAGACLILAAAAMAVETPGVDTPSVVTNRPAEGVLVLRAGAGTVAYRESGSIQSVKSDFDTAVFGAGAHFVYTDPVGFKLRLAGEAWASGEDRERWTGGGQVLQRNDLEVSGFEIDGDFGYGLGWAPGRELTLWLGLGWAGQSFERSRFRSYQITGAESTGAHCIGEDYLVGLFRLGADGSVALGRRLVLSGGVVFGLAFYSEADNEVLGSMDGDGGNTVDAGADLAYAVSAADALGVGIRYRLQQLDGDVAQALVATPEGLIQQVAEWPDNELERWTADLFWVHRF